MATDPTVAELIANGPPPAADDKTTFLGVPKKYIYSRPRPAPTPGSAADLRSYEEGYTGASGTTQDYLYQAAPRYKAGYELTPASQSPEVIANLQSKLAAAGLIGPKTQFRVGTWDSVSISAYRQLLSYANVNGMDEVQALSALADAPKTTLDKMAGGDTQMGVRTYQVSDPTGLIQTLQAQAKDTLGHELSDETANEFVKLYQGMQTSAQAQQYAAADTPTVGTGSGPVTITQPDPGAEAAKFAKEQDPTGAASYSMVQAGDVIRRMMRGGTA